MGHSTNFQSFLLTRCAALLARAGESERVLVLVFSEFGRRLTENASGGTDHGTAAPVFLVGPQAEAGIQGEHPNLGELEDGDPRHVADFRQVYATLLDHWLDCPSETILGGPFEHLPLIKARDQ
ncbi:MAG: DUF1501 domain-containing protein [Pirellulales bacterium]